MGSFVLRVQGDSSTFVLNFANPVKSVSALLMATEISIIRWLPSYPYPARAFFGCLGPRGGRGGGAESARVL